MTTSTNVETKTEELPKTDINELTERLNVLQASNERLLAESKDWKKKFQAESSEKSSNEKARLEKEGNFQQLLEQEKGERSALEIKVKDREKQLLKTQARALLAEYAKDAHDIGDLLRLDEVSAIQYDEEKLSVVSESVKAFVASVREKKPWMFGEKKIPSSTDGKPSNNAPAKTFNELSSQEREQLMKNSFKNIL